MVASPEVPGKIAFVDALQRGFQGDEISGNDRRYSIARIEVLPTEAENPIRGVLVQRIDDRLTTSIETDEKLKKFTDSEKLGSLLKLITNAVAIYVSLDITEESRKTTIESIKKSLERLDEYKALKGTKPDDMRDENFAEIFDTVVTYTENIIYEEMGKIIQEVISHYWQENFQLTEYETMQFVPTIFHQLVKATNDSIYPPKIVPLTLYNRALTPDQFLAGGSRLADQTWLRDKIFETKKQLNSGVIIEVSEQVRTAVLEMARTSLDLKIKKTNELIYKLQIMGDPEEYYKVDNLIEIDMRVNSIREDQARKNHFDKIDRVQVELKRLQDGLKRIEAEQKK